MLTLVFTIMVKIIFIILYIIIHANISDGDQETVEESVEVTTPRDAVFYKTRLSPISVKNGYKEGYKKFQRENFFEINFFGLDYVLKHSESI